MIFGGSWMASENTIAMGSFLFAREGLISLFLSVSLLFP